MNGKAFIMYNFQFSFPGAVNKPLPPNWSNWQWFFFSTLGQCLIILIISLALVAAIQMNVSDQYIHYFWHCELDPKLTFIHYSLLNLCMQLNDIPIKPPSFSTQIKKAFMDTKNMLQISKSIKAEQYGTIKPISPLF